ncbi:S53 family peptidase [Actinocorallia libanotica]|uniref:Peptidase S53 domain-containing protein n=1 Tax=Actinocorallia libanotica TaxID=46162 RepID=A0ABN1RER0_9ACTN
MPRQTGHLALPTLQRPRWRRLSALALPCALALAAGCGTAEPVRPPAPLPSYDECVEKYKSGCYTPTQVLRAYGLDRLHAQGMDGRGTTIAIVIPAANPYVQKSMDDFSDQFDLPRTRIEVINRGAPPLTPDDPVANLAAHEATTDLQIAHAAAPKAKLLYVQVGFDHLAGIGEVMKAIDWLTRQRRVDVISMSLGASEPSVLQLAGGRARFDELRQPLIAANRTGTTLLASTGDTGSGGHDLTGDQRRRAVAWPASDPLVTAVGGSRLHLDAQGQRTGPDEVWGSPSPLTTQKGATGAGTSTLFPRPAHQDHAAALLGQHRGVPDLLANAAPESAVWIHTTHSQGKPIVKPARGTSIAAPLVAGIVAIAAQQASRPLGDIGPALHRHADRPQDAGLADITQGCNHTATIQGHCAAPGYDLVSGLGALNDAAQFVQALTTEAP